MDGILTQKIQDLRKHYLNMRKAAGAPNTGWVFDEHFNPASDEELDDENLEA